MDLNLYFVKLIERLIVYTSITGLSKGEGKNQFVP